ncbi:hypothetical protein O988_08363 [Pseudogymnoascus sp. VKM F-3808]|nr:hypothetical protein O988_08363 [Pseudogymnoascus sp. VKM F-3808]
MSQCSTPAPSHTTPAAHDDDYSLFLASPSGVPQKSRADVARAAISPRLEPAGAYHVPRRLYQQEGGGFDMTNLVLGQTSERIIRPHDDDEPSSEVQHGLYIVRGDNVTVVGLVDEELDESINWNEVRGAVIGGVKHSA